MSNKLIKHIAIEDNVYDIADEYAREQIEHIIAPTLPIKWHPVPLYVEISTQEQLYQALEKYNDTIFDLRIHINASGSYTLSQRDGNKSVFNSITLHIFSTVPNVELDMCGSTFYNCHINFGGNSENTRLKIFNTFNSRVYYDNCLVNMQYMDMYCAIVQYGGSNDSSHISFYDTDQDYCIRLSTCSMAITNPKLYIDDVSNKNNFDFCQVFTNSIFTQRGSFYVKPLLNKSSGINRLFNLGTQGTITGSTLILDGSVRNLDTGDIYEAGEGTYDLSLSMFKATYKSNPNGYNALKNVSVNPASSMTLPQCEVVMYQSY